MTKVLVTGGAGYVGSHTCKALARAGYSPVVFDDLSRGHDWAVKWGPLERGSILDRARLDEAIEIHSPSAIMHFAALAYVGESMEQPAVYYRNNVVGSLCLLDAARKVGVDRIIFSSSCATYGQPETDVLTEDHVQKPINPYGTTKLMIEQCLADYGTAYGLKSISLRYFNAAGADLDGEIGEDHDPEPHLIPRAIGSALGTDDVLTVFGSDYDTPDGTCIRDFVHVDDLAEAHVLALQSLSSDTRCEVVNLGTGIGYSIMEVLAAVERVSGKKVPYRLGSRRPGDPGRLVASSDKAARLLGWQPRSSDLETIIASALSWHQGRT